MLVAPVARTSAWVRVFSGGMSPATDERACHARRLAVNDEFPSSCSCDLKELRLMRRIVLAAALVSAANVAFAQVPASNSRPSPTPKVDTIPLPRDVPFPGTMQ